MEVTTFSRRTIIFCCVLIFLVIPPIFTTSSNPSLSYSIIGLFSYGLLSLYICFYYGTINKKNRSCDRVIHFLISPDIKKKIICLYSIVALILLLLSEYVFTRIALSKVKMVTPDSILGWINTISGIFVYAFFEESLYRLYLPEELDYLINEKLINSSLNTKKRKVIAIFNELICIAVFAAAHSANGIITVCNAFVAGVILRVLAVKTESLFPPLMVHFLYNFISCSVAAV